MRNALRSLRLSLPARIYEEIRAEALTRGLPATVIARQVLEDGLRERHRRDIREKTAEYARRYAGTPEDLDTALEAAGIEWLGRSRERGDRV